MPTVSIKCRVRALYPFKSNDPSSLSFDQGDSIEVLTKLESGWWDGWCKGARGWFPSNYVEIIEEYKDESCFIADHAVPLRRNNEYRLSLPMTNIGTTLPPNWSLQMTEDKSGCYFYNHATGEMRSTHPDD
ncbi:SH3 domain-containing protein, partial [Radiomyces spectabilis]|uniref:SH3 domain-containing protein n=1 Tax=Radiomyces spectabilis TaxID=64574 RepID=UPI0022206C46